MKRSIVVFSLMAMSGLAFADGFSYTYVQATYGNVDVDNSSVDGDGLALNGSYGITDSLNIVGNLQTADFDSVADSDEWRLGLGVHAPITDLMDVTASVSYVDTSLDAFGVPGLEDDGFALDVGIRANIVGKIEVNAGVSYVDLSSAGDDVGFGGGALYNFNDMFSVGLSAKWEEKWGTDTATYALSGRISFGK
jgi:Outer membrane protein beta-barrel domain